MKARVLFFMKSVIFAWLLPYVILLLIPIIITSVAYKETNKIVENQINRNNTLILEKAQKHMDGLLNDINKICINIMFDPQIQDIAKFKKTFSNVQYYAIQKAFEDFKIQKISYNSINDVYVYFNKNDMIMSTSMCTELKAYYDAYFNCSEGVYKELNESVSKRYKGNYIKLPGSDGQEAENIVYARSFPLGGNMPVSMNILVEIDGKNFIEDLDNREMLNEGLIYIVNSNNSVILSTRHVNLSQDLLYDNLPISNELLYTDFEGEDMVVSCRNSNVNDWKYVLVIPSRMYWEKTQYIRKLTAVSILLFIVLGGFISIFFLRKNYNPLKELIKLFSKQVHLNYDKKFNEYSFIENALNITIDEKEKIKYKLGQQNKTLRAVFLTRLLKGRELMGATLEDSLSTYEIHFETEYFIVIVINIKNPGYVAEEKNLSSDQKVKFIKFIITNVVEELAGRKNTGYMAEIDDMLVCLVNLKNTKPDEWKSELALIVEGAREFLFKKYEISFSASISNIHKTVYEIPQAYNEALELAEYKKVVGIQDITHYSDVMDKGWWSKNDYKYSLETEYRLINAIKAGNFERAKSIINSVFELNTSISLQMAKCLMVNITSTMVKTVNEMSSICDRDYLENLNIVDRLIHCESIVKMKYELINIFEGICKHISKNRNDQHMELVNNIKEYIKHNYQDCSLSISMLGDILGMTPSYIGTIFKKITDESIVDHINKIRVDRAKKLLHQKGSSVNDVADEVGYTSGNVFIRIYKKYEGITPGEYKKLQVKSN